MAQKRARLRLLEDARLTDSARMLGMYIEAMGPRPREIAHDEFARVLHGTPGTETVRRHLRQLALFGYIERTPGGRGHSDLYCFKAEPDEDLDPRETEDLNHTIAPHSGEGLNGIGPRENEGLNGKAAAGCSDSPPLERGPKILAPRKNEGLSSRARVRVDGDDDDGDNPSIISPAAERAIETAGEKLHGCRGALRDYLAARVPPDRQAGYVQLLVGWRDGIDANVFRRPDGSSVPADDQCPVLANALNDLAASDESQMKRPTGDPANLRTKINILLRSTVPRRTDSAPRAAAVGGRGTPQQFDYSNATTKFKGFTP